MNTVQFLGGPHHGEEQTLDRGSRPTILVKPQVDEPRAAVYVYYSPTEQYVFGSYISNEQAAA